MPPRFTNSMMSFVKPGLWVHLARTYPVDPAFYGRAAFITFNSLATTPLRWIERARCGPQIAAARVQPPLFVLGYWRSGTTLLHELLALDPNHAAMTTLQATASPIMLAGEHLIRPVFSRLIPEKRPMDAMLLGTDRPQEDEAAMVNLTQRTPYHRFSFPRQTRHFMDRYALFDDASNDDIQAWQRDYLNLFQRLTVKHGPDKRLVSKNPVNMARIPHLLKLFPSARFVHIVRDPYAVFVSERHTLLKSLPLTQLQQVDLAQLEADQLYVYERLMQRYLDERALIPAGQLAEIRFEDFAPDPLATLAGVYATLNLPGWDAARPHLAADLELRAGYQRNQLEISAEDRARVASHWGFALAAWDYDQPVP